MKNNTLIATILIVLIVSSLAFVYVQRQKSVNTGNANKSGEESYQMDYTQPSEVISVTANKNTFTPNAFSVNQTKSLNLKVTAVDHDYQFSVEGYPRINMSLRKGETTNVLIEALGIGEYIYTCGTGCKGTITVLPEPD